MPTGIWCLRVKRRYELTSTSVTSGVLARPALPLAAGVLPNATIARSLDWKRSPSCFEYRC